VLVISVFALFRCEEDLVFLRVVVVSTVVDRDLSAVLNAIVSASPMPN